MRHGSHIRRSSSFWRTESGTDLDWATNSIPGQTTTIFLRESSRKKKKPAFGQGQSGAVRERPVAVPTHAPKQGGAHDAQGLIVKCSVTQVKAR